MNVTLPNGRVIQGVPEGTTKEQIKQKAIAAGIATEQEFPTAKPEFGTQEYAEQAVAGLGEEVARPDQPKPIAEPSTIGEKLVGAGEAALALGTGATGGLAGQIGGAITGLVGEIAAGNYGEQEAADRIKAFANEMARKFTYEPRTAEGQAQTRAVAETLQPLEAIPPLAELQALSAASGFAAPHIAKASGAPARTVENVLNKTPFQRKMRKAIEESTPDAPANETAKYIISESGRVKSDPIAIEAIRQGFDEGVIASLKGSTKQDRAAMRSMIDVLQKGKRSARYARENRPSDIVGRSIMDRFKAVQMQNKQAGKQLDGVAQSLKGQNVDVRPAVDSFLGALDKLDVSTQVVDGRVVPKFSGSMIEGLSGPETAIKRIFNRMNKSKIDALDVHKMKRFIDEQVSYGKASGEGLTGQTENALKTLRRGLDEALDSAFPEYDRVNTQYADTRGALEAFTDVAGKKFDPLGSNADKQVGTLSRRMLGNAQSRVPLIDAIKSMEDAARKYGAQIDGDITTQAMFFDELERMFGSSAPTSIQGIGEKVVDVATRSKADILAGAAKGVVEKARGINEEKAIQAIIDLLESQNQN